MGTILLCCALAMGAEATPGGAGQGSAERPYHDLYQEMNASLRDEAAAGNLGERGQAIRALCALHAEIVADPRFDKSNKLKEYRAKIWSRLLRTKADLNRDLARDRNAPPLDADAEAAALQAADSLAASLALADYSLGGPGYLLARGGGPIAGDNGQALVDLITRTINPQFWDVAGGPGAIVYYAQWQCLVVTATAEIHGNLGGVLGGIRRAGK